MTNEDIIFSTMNDLPGYEIEEVYGEVFGLTVRTRNIGSQFGAGLKSLVGGELKDMTKMLAAGRIDATQRLAVLAFRFDTADFANMGTEICSYGTAARVRRKM